jgi:hypothetical protein
MEEEVEDESVLELDGNEDVEESIDKELETILLSAQRERERELGCLDNQKTGDYPVRTCFWLLRLIQFAYMYIT